MIESSDLYEIVDESGLPAAPVMLMSLSGYVDAGSAATGVVQQILGSMEHRVVARFDADLLVDYRARRPQIVFAEDHYADFQEPELLVRLVDTPEGESFLLLDGPEPDIMWARFGRAVVELAQRWNVRLVASFYGIPMGVPHTRPLGLTMHGNRRELVSIVNPWEGEVGVPSHIGAVLELRLGEAGIDSVGYVAHVPHYLAQAEYPDASLSLVTALSQGTGLHLPVDSLETAAEQTRALVAEQVAENTDVQRVVQALEVQYDAYMGGEARGNLIAARAEMPDADEIGAEFEEYLAGLPADDGPPSGSGHAS